MNEESSYLDALLVHELFDNIEDVKVSRYHLEVEVKYEMDEEGLIDFLEGRGWSYQGVEKSGAPLHLTRFVFEL